jgi:Nif-specific regulatory protein
MVLGTGARMRQVYKQIEQFANTGLPALITGEGGTGKERIARAIHRASDRAARPFVKASCSALSATLAESALFGHERGAFPTATTRRRGQVELADGGTLLLEEVGRIDYGLQKALLRLLTDGEFERVGGTKTVSVDVRLLVSTIEDLELAVRERRLVPELYERLALCTVPVPPLREHLDDVPMLVEHLVDGLSRRHRKSVKQIARPALDMLVSYQWPENIRELERLIERAVLACDGDTLYSQHFPQAFQAKCGVLTSLEHAVGMVEKDLIQRALAASAGNCAKAARLLQTTQRILAYKIRAHGLDPGTFKPFDAMAATPAYAVSSASEG